MNAQEFLQKTGVKLPSVPENLDVQMPALLARLLNDPDFRILCARLMRDRDALLAQLPLQLKQGNHAAAAWDAGRAQQLILLLGEIADAPRAGHNLAALNR